MTKNLFLFTLILLTVTALACTSSNVRTDYDEGASFVLMQSFGWMPEPPPAPVPQGSRRPVMDNVRIRQIIERSITQELTKGGYSLGLFGPPDFLVAYHAVSVGGVDISNWGYEQYFESVEIQEYDEGTLIIDVIDNETKRLIWRGSAPNILSGSGQAKEKISRAIQEILKKFPPD